MARFLVKIAKRVQNYWEDMMHENDLGEGDPNIWYKDLEKHAYGQISFAVVQANLNMEDYSQVEIGHNATFVGVYDGHGGTEASHFVSQHLFPNFISDANEHQVIYRDTIERAVRKTENEFVAYVRDKFDERPAIAAVGSCCLAAVIWGNRLVIGNMGDSRAILGTISNQGRMAFRAEQITHDQNVSRVEVRQEVLADNPNDPHILVRDQPEGTWRIRGIIQVYRTIGDEYLKWVEFALGPEFGYYHLNPPLTRPALRSDPVMFSKTLNENDRFLVFGSDGLWEHVTNEKVVKIVNKYPRQAIARRLLSKAMKAAAKKAYRSYWSLRTTPNGNARRAIHDDITVIVVFIDHEYLNQTSNRVPEADQASLQSRSDEVGPSMFTEMRVNADPFNL